MTSFFLLRSRDLCIFKEGKTRSLFQSHLNMNEDLLNYDEFEIWRPFAWVSALVNAADAAGSLRPRSGSARENDTQTTSQLITSVFPGLAIKSNVLCCFWRFDEIFGDFQVWKHWISIQFFEASREESWCVFSVLGFDGGILSWRHLKCLRFFDNWKSVCLKDFPRY